MKLLRTLLLLGGVVLVACAGLGLCQDRSGETAPPLDSGVWISGWQHEPPALVDGRPAGWTLYAYFRPD